MLFSATVIGAEVEMGLSVKEVVASTALCDPNAPFGCYVQQGTGKILVDCPQCVGSDAVISIVDIYGRTVESLQFGEILASTYVELDLVNTLHVGTYFVKLSSKNYSAVEKLIFTDK